MGTFADYDISLRFRDAVTRLTKGILDVERPVYRYATVTAIDRPNRKCTVQFTGEAGTVTVAMGSVQPSAVGQKVRVNGIGADKYVEDVIGSAYLPFLPKYEEFDTGWIYLGNPGAPAYQNGMTSYALTAAGGGHHGMPRFRRIGDIVYMEGLVGSVPAANYTTIFNLPVGFRPDGDIIPVGLGNGATENQGIRVLANGDVVTGTGVSAWTSLVCQFPVAGGNYTWHIIGAAGEPAFGSGWSNYGSTWQTARFCKIGDYVYLQGLVQRTSGTNQNIFTLPTGYINTNGTTHTPCAAVAAMGGGDFGVNIAAAVNSRAVGSNTGYVSLSGIKFFVGVNDAKWKKFRGGADGFYTQVANGAYGSPWPVPAVRRDGKIIFMEGLTNFTANGVEFKLPYGYAPGQQLIVPVVNSASRRVDIRSANDDDTPNGPSSIATTGGGVNGFTHSWVVDEQFENDIRWNG